MSSELVSYPRVQKQVEVIDPVRVEHAEAGEILLAGGLGLAGGYLLGRSQAYQEGYNVGYAVGLTDGQSRQHPISYAQGVHSRDWEVVSLRLEIARLNARVQELESRNGQSSQGDDAEQTPPKNTTPGVIFDNLTQLWRSEPPGDPSQN